MCLLVLAIGACARWPLVIAANRDEHRKRPTLALSKWLTGDGATLLSGRDLRAGGTWLGSTPSGRVALLTNVREAAPVAGRLSRGDLPLRWLSGQMSATEFLTQHEPGDYGGCNLVMGDFQRSEWTWASNRKIPPAGNFPQQLQSSPDWQTKSLAAGIYGLSNALLDTPWPKTLALKAAMQQALTAAQKTGDETHLLAPLWSALASREPAPRHALPQTGVLPALEHALSSAYVDIPERDYGTR